MVLPHRNSHRSYQFRLSFFWALFLGLLLLPACRQAAPEPVVLDAGQVFEQDVIAALPAPPTYRIGINTEVTGTGAQIGDLSLRAARLAIEEINAAGGVNGVPLELIVRDARSDPAVALAEYQRAVAEDDLDALLGPFKSAFGVRIVPEHIGQPLPMFIGATNATLTQQGDPHLFRMRPSDQMTAPAMLAFILEQIPTARIGLIHDTDAFGSGGADRIAADLAALGRPAPLRLGYVTGTTEFDGLVQQLAEAQVEAILIYGTNQTDVGHLLRAVRYWDLEVPIVTSPVGASVVTRNVAGAAQDDIYAVLDANLEAWPKGRRFQQAFLDRFGLPPDTYITWYYDAIHLLAQIWSDYPEARGEQLSRLIRATQYEGAQGVYCFDEAGEGLHRVTIAQVVAGQLQPVMVYGEAGLAAYAPALAAAPCPEDGS